MTSAQCRTLDLLHDITDHTLTENLPDTVVTIPSLIQLLIKHGDRGISTTDLRAALPSDIHPYHADLIIATAQQIGWITGKSGCVSLASLTPATPECRHNQPADTCPKCKRYRQATEPDPSPGHITCPNCGGSQFHILTNGRIACASPHQDTPNIIGCGWQSS